MGHQKLRENKTCLNCNYVVENKFCPNCGQENTETRQSFHYLFTHFVEDLTHYDGSFWKTIKNLLFKPGFLTKEYLEGKRKKFVPPVKLYIFISFVTFLLPSLLPNVTIFGKKNEMVETSAVNLNVKEKKPTENATYSKKEDGEGFSGIEVKDKVSVKSIKQLDSLQNALPENDKISYFKYIVAKTGLKVYEEKGDNSFWEKAIEYSFHILPKVLFLYMPVFAFFLWLLHDKKKRYYFDSGVFTLHYFSFLLLVFTIGVLLDWILNLIYSSEGIIGFYVLVAMVYCFFYFFRAHSRFFGEEKIISRLKSIILFFINIFLISIFTLVLFMYSIWHVK